MNSPLDTPEFHAALGRLAAYIAADLAAHPRPAPSLPTDATPHKGPDVAADHGTHRTSGPLHFAQLPACCSEGL